MTIKIKETTERDCCESRDLKNLCKAAKPLIKFLNNYHPHVTVIVTPTSIELLEGIMGDPAIDDFVKD